MESIRQEKEVYGIRRCFVGHRNRRLGVWLVVLATACSLVGCQHLKTGAATMGLYTRGGTVFTAATTDWSHGLRGNDAVVECITRNVLDHLSE